MRSRAQAGFALVETLVAVAVIALVAAGACACLAQRPAQAASTAAAFAQLVAQARAVAALDASANGGASIGVTREGGVCVATLFRSRPIPGASPPAIEPRTPPLRSATAIVLVRDGIVSAPPFAIFVSPAGHASAQAGYTIGRDAALAVEPACPSATGVVVGFVDGVHNQAHPLTCESAHLDLERSASVAESSGASP